MKNLNEAQKQAIFHEKGHLLIVAGPGTGKTHTLTQKIFYLLGERKIDRKHVVALTFTTKAAEEMRSRLALKLPKNSDLPFVGTFHAFCLQILRDHRRQLHFDKFTLLNTKKQEEIFNEIADSLKLADTQLEDFKKLLSFAKNQLLFFSNDRSHPEIFKNELFMNFYQLYAQRCESQKLVDFDDLLLKTLELLENHPRIQSKISKQLKYLFVDEYQDVNEAQYRLIRLFLSPKTKLCAIGDPDQAIYAFRGSNLSHFLRFEKDFPGTTVLRLNQNYRSTEKILQAADKLIQNNTRRIHKDIYTKNEAGDDLQLFTFEDEWHEAHFVRKEIAFLVGGTDMTETDRGMMGGRYFQKNNFQFSDIAVLYRTKAQARIFEEIFNKNGIPYQCLSKTPWYKKKEIQTLLSYLFTLCQPDDDVHFFDLLESSPCRVPPEVLQELQKEAKKRNVSLLKCARDFIDDLRTIPDLQRKILGDIAWQIHILRETLFPLKTSQAVHEVFLEFGLRVPFNETIPREAKKLQNLANFLAYSHRFDHLPASEGFAALCEHFTLLQDQDLYNKEMQAVSLMTFHAAKGLEFPVIFLAGLEEGFLPLKKKNYVVDIEEERRLFYVGITRAQKKLYFLSPQVRNEEPVSPSLFLTEIKEFLHKIHLAAAKRKKRDSMNNIQTSLFAS